MWSTPESMPRVLIETLLAGGSVVLGSEGPVIRGPLRWKLKMAPMLELVKAWIGEHHFEAPTEEDLQGWRDECAALRPRVEALKGAPWRERWTVEETLRALDARTEKGERTRRDIDETIRLQARLAAEREEERRRLEQERAEDAASAKDFLVASGGRVVNLSRAGPSSSGSFPSAGRIEVDVRDHGSREEALGWGIRELFNELRERWWR